jgi:hypothetical protein
LKISRFRGILLRAFGFIAPRLTFHQPHPRHKLAQGLFKLNERTGELQEEIMWVAEAAHLPVIWATQVLENFAKKGQRSRAEITDAAMEERAECVMLNKEPFTMRLKFWTTYCAQCNGSRPRRHRYYGL